MTSSFVISIDHGNHHMKTLHHSFPAGLVESSHLATFGKDVLGYAGHQYMIADRKSQKNDKTADDDYFKLTLIAIAKELVGNESFGLGSATTNIELLVGLPPAHFREMESRFKNYFMSRGERIAFKFNGQLFTICITGVKVYPQAYAAAFSMHDKLRDSRTINIVDLGGYTVDCLRLTDLQVDANAATSLHKGINKLFQSINQKVRATCAEDMLDVEIEGILRRDFKTMKDYSPKQIELITSTARAFARELLLEVSQTGLNLANNRTLFIGGGAMLLREYLEEVNLVMKPTFTDDIHANARGYQYLYDLEQRAARLKS